MNEKQTSPPNGEEPFSRVTVDLNDPAQLAAVSDYYLTTFGEKTPLVPEAERMRRALEQFALQFGLHDLSEPERKAPRLSPDERLLVALILGLVVLSIVLCVVPF